MIKNNIADTFRQKPEGDRYLIYTARVLEFSVKSMIIDSLHFLYGLLLVANGEMNWGAYKQSVHI